jgi:APA family basic amino acid/polyamine antiporter
MSRNLKKEIGFFGLTMIAVGACIGSGVFLTPSDIALQLGNGKWVIVAWLIGGVVALTGALTFAELGALFPEAGGVYAYLQKGYGKMIAFLYGWSILTVITSGAIAALSLAFARYVAAVVPLSEAGVLVTAASALIAVTLINVFGVKLGELFSSVFTSFKLIGIAAVVLCGIFLGSQIQGNLSNTENSMSVPASAMALALIGVLWSYGGWHHASYLSAETKNAQKVVPRAMILGAFIVTLTYVLVNLAYMSLLTIPEMSASQAVAADAIEKLVPAGAVLIAVLIAISTFGTAGIYTLSAPRIYFAMGRDGTFFSWLAKIHPKYGTPFNAILLQSGWALVLLFFWGTFEKLITYVVFMDWIFMILAALSLFIFRRQNIRKEGTYRTLGYPITPIIFIGISTWFIIYTIIGRPEQAIAGLILLLIGVPVFLFFKAKNKQKTGS